MSSKAPQPVANVENAENAEDEISALLATLRKTGERFEELTGGEVDSVVDRSGRTFLMRGVQEQLRHADDARQSAILNALPAHIALLDARGEILSVNEAWRGFGAANGLHSPGHAVGVNYLGVCDAARGNNAAEAKQAADGIRAVLAGARESFSLEYPCHSPSEQRWFLMVVSPLAGDPPAGAVVLHLSVTERRQAQDSLIALSESTAKRERMLSTMLSGMDDFAYTFDRQGRFQYANQALISMLGIAPGAIVGKNFFDLGIPEDLAARMQAQIQAVFETRQSVTDETPFTSPAGVPGLYEYIFSPVLASDGNVDFVVGSTRNVTERKAAESRIKRLNRIYAVQSSISSAIVRIHERPALFREVCRIALAEGGFTLARVIEVDAAGQARLAETTESDPTLVQRIIGEYNADRERTPSLLALALHGGEPLVSNDVANDPRLPHRAALTKDGSYALCILPFHVGPRLAGVILLHAREAGAFNEAEMRLLGELVANLSLALEHLEQAEHLRRLGAEQARNQEDLQRFGAAMDTISDAIYLVDRASMSFIHVNAAACRMRNRTREEMLALGPMKLLDTSRAELERTYDAIIASGVDAAPLEMQRQRDDGSRVWVELRRHAQLTRDRWTIITLVRDITQRRRAEQDLRQFRTAMDSSGDAIALIDRASMRYIDVNRTVCDLTGYMREELIGMTPMDLLGVERAELERVYDAVIADGGRSVSTIEGEYRHKDGTLIPIETHRRALQLDGAWIIVGSSRDITERRQIIMALRESERRFSDILGNVELISMMVDREARITYCNEYLLRLTGWAHGEIIGRSWAEIFLPPEDSDSPVRFAALLAGAPGTTHRENEILKRSGERVMVRWNNTLLRSGAGEVVGWASIGEDITEQMRDAARILRLNRVYAVLSGINALIVRVRNRDELLQEACRIAVAQGGFQLVWLGIIDRTDMTLTPVASAGTTEELLVLARHRFSLQEENPVGNALSAQAIREKKAVVANDLRTDARIVYGEEHAKRGTRSLAVLPLLLADEVVGTMAMYSAEAGFFDEEELKLLNRLASDIAFAIDLIDKRKQLEYLSYYDALTGLANRTLFLERVAQYVRGAAAGGHRLAVFLVDLERFRNVNDSLGRPAGDALLKQVAEWLTLNAGDPNLIGRIGADQFAMVLPHLRPEGSLTRLLDKTMAAFMLHPFRVEDSLFRIAIRAGVSLYPDDGANADTLLKNAEGALKQAKAGGERYLLYAQGMSGLAAGKLTLENQLREALDRNEFVLHYQPKLNLATGKITGAEALIRWNDPRTGLVPPGRFIPILEETGLINDVGRWALRQALNDYLRWREAGLPAVRIAVNLSPLQLRSRAFTSEIEQLLSIDAQAAAGLELEITESLIMADVKHSIASLKAVRALGVTVAIDDFGTGFSSLSYLARLPVDTLKIDRSFVTDMMAGPDGLALVSTIINLAHSLKLNVVAEGVETEEQSRLLRLLHCDEMQGFLFSKPVPAADFEARFLAAPETANVRRP